MLDFVTEVSEGVAMSTAVAFADRGDECVRAGCAAEKAAAAGRETVAARGTVRLGRAFPMAWPKRAGADA